MTVQAGTPNSSHVRGKAVTKIYNSGWRSRVTCVGFEDRKLLLGHKSDHVTTHYSAPEIGALI